MKRGRVLVVDDKPTILKLLAKVLGDAGLDVVTADDGTRALALVASDEFDVVLSDIKMPGPDGHAVLREVKRSHPDVEVVLMTGHASVEKAVEAMKEGAYDYVEKPFDPDKALVVVTHAVERKRLREQARDLRSALEGSARFENLVAKSRAMAKVIELMRRAAASDLTVLITGESGTGKEVVARGVHAASARKERRFVAVNCGAIPDTLLEAELFGHMRGAFTGATADHRGLFEEADGGTLFLDEIGELPLAMQVKLTRVLQERAVRRVGGSDERRIDVRVITATNVDLKAAVAAGRFRDDLYYRINIFPIHLPPLRERREDIPMLAALFVERHAARQDGRPEGFTPEALAALIEHDWPGNVRELENVVQRALAVAEGPRIGVAALPEEVVAAAPPRAPGGAGPQSYREVVELARDRASREFLVALMKDVGGNVTQAAERAGMERESLHRLLKRHGLRSEDFKTR
jgi:DNA-binding NtrC family response regulator